MEDVKLKFELTKELFLSNPKSKFTKLSGSDYKNSPSKACFWSPDGTCLLTSNDDAHFRLYELPTDPPLPEVIKPVLDIPRTECIYSMDWYPKMSSLDPVTSVFISTARASPIHLLDAFNGSIRATYRCYDEADEVTAAMSVKFDRTGGRIYGGLTTGRIDVFDTAIPGRDPLKRYGKGDIGLGRGIISCIVSHPVVSFLFAAASYNRRAAIYDTRRKSPLLLKLEGQKSGITYASFSKSGDLFLTGGRKNNEIVVWDLRNPGKLFGILKRTVETNQRIHFHALDNDLVISGNTDGSIKVYDLKSSPIIVNNEPHISPIWSQDNVHQDCVNGVHVHPSLPLLSTTSGQRNYSKPCVEGDDEEVDAEKINKRDNSLGIWNMSFL